MTSLDPVWGGLLIGASASLLLWSIGRVAGISGILWHALRPVLNNGSERAWRIAFLVGLVLGPALLVATGERQPPTGNDSGWGVLVVAGLLVGFGTRLASGCTSGHGICGLAQFSPRSLIATVVFMGCGILTVFFARHVLG